MSAKEHYDNHLAGVYAWSLGGAAAAVEKGEAELEALGALPASTRVAVDLGAGFGAHAIPLARRGFRVFAVDSSAYLLRELQRSAGSLPIACIEADLADFDPPTADAPELILCMGDTITHLPDEKSVERLISNAAAALAPGGRLFVTLRDYSEALTDVARFIPVRSDANRILTCFLEYGDDTLMVHDLLHERSGNEWKLRASAYQKLRIAPRWVIDEMKQHGLRVNHGAGVSGMVRIEGRREI